MQEAQKIGILQAALSERYSALKTIRERVQSVGLAVMGLLFGAGGWLIQSTKTFSRLELVVAGGGLIVAIAVLRFVYLRDLETGFRSQQLVAAKIEKALGLHTAGALSSEPGAIYPTGWADAGSKSGGGRFFRATHALIYVSTIFVLAALVVAGSATQHSSAYTLYRSSATPGAVMRIHVATYDAADGDAYNHENCNVATGLFQKQAGVTVHYWCEMGRYRR